MIVHGLAESEHYTYCEKLHHPGLVTIQVHTCSQYDDKRLPELQDLKLIAWKLATDKAGKKIGFMSPQKYRELERDKKLDTDSHDEDIVIDPFTKERVY